MTADPDAEWIKAEALSETETIIRESGRTFSDKESGYLREMLHEELRAAYARGVATERHRCAADVCWYCGGRATSYNRVPAGPDGSGSWVHKHLNGCGRVEACRASGIWNRLEVEREESEVET